MPEKKFTPSRYGVPKAPGHEMALNQQNLVPEEQKVNRRKLDFHKAQAPSKRALLEQAGQLANETGVILPEMPNYYYLAEYGEELIGESHTITAELVEDGLDEGKARKRAIQIAHRNAVKLLNERIKGETDPLTGLRNRSGFDRLVLHMVQDAGEANEPVCILVGDVNGLKVLNDTKGHAAGDELIHKTGSVLDSRHRDTDLFSMLEARYGGDEFRAVFPATDKKGVKAWFDERSGEFDNSGVSIGLGVVEITAEEIQGCQSEADLLNLIERKCEIADSASYAAKDIAKKLTKDSGQKKSWLLTDDDEEAKTQYRIMHEARLKANDTVSQTITSSQEMQ